jgi:hypothetical protein
MGENTVYLLERFQKGILSICESPFPLPEHSRSRKDRSPLRSPTAFKQLFPALFNTHLYFQVTLVLVYTRTAIRATVKLRLQGTHLQVLELELERSIVALVSGILSNCTVLRTARIAVRDDRRSRTTGF